MKGKRSKLKLIAAVSMSIFSLAVLFMGTFAWFAATRSQLFTTNPFPVSTSSGKFKKLTIHELDTTKDNTSTYHFKGVETGSIEMNWATGEPGDYTGDPLSFGIYELTRKSHPLLFIYEFVEEIEPNSNNPVSITAKTEATFVADGELDEHDDTIIKLHERDNPLSSVVNFKSFSYEANNDEDITGIDTYNSETSTFDYPVSSLTSPQSFVSLTTVGNELTYTGFDDEKTLFSATTGKVNYVAIVMNYYSDALEYIYNFYLGTEALEHEYIFFTCDWTILIV